MIIEQSRRFEEELEVIVDFIAKDSPSRAFSFFEELLSKIKDIPLNPYIYRKRESLDDDMFRELIFKGYTIPFYIDAKNDKIVILGIFNQNLWS